MRKRTESGGRISDKSSKWALGSAELKKCLKKKHRKTIMKDTNKPILLLEDDKVDMMSVTRALKQIHVTNKIVHRENGEDGLNYLRNETNDKPCIILLDLNMPIMNGIEFLQAVKNDDRFKHIPVVILTTSDEQQDKLSSFNFGVAGYMSKPVDYWQFVEVIRSIDAYWTISEMP